MGYRSEKNILPKRRFERRRRRRSLTRSLSSFERPRRRRCVRVCVRPSVRLSNPCGHSWPKTRAAAAAESKNSRDLSGGGLEEARRGSRGERAPQAPSQTQNPSQVGEILHIYLRCDRQENWARGRGFKVGASSNFRTAKLRAQTMGGREGKSDIEQTV